MARAMFVVSDAEMAQLKELAEAEGVSLSTLVYRKVFDKPDAQRKSGRPPKHKPAQREELFPMTG